MARLPRLALAGLPHYLRQRGHDGTVIVRDDEDRGHLLAALREAARSHHVALHAYAVLPSELHLLATPEGHESLSNMMQSVGRRYAAGFNRRHGRSGALWDGRFRGAVLEPGAVTLLALRVIDRLGLVDADPDALPSALHCSAGHRAGARRDAALVDPAVYWQLGNTPFEREARYRQLLNEAPAQQEELSLHQAVRSAWAFGSPAFQAEVAERTARPVAPRARGRPRRRP